MTEIFGTLGPACADYETLDKMFRNGMTGIRLNLSHAGLKESSEMIRNYHRAAAGNHVKGDLLIDLQGPEVRITLPEDIFLQPEQTVLFGKSGIGLQDNVLRGMEIGDSILLDDGKIRAEIIRKTDTAAYGIVRRGGLLQNRKSLKIEGKEISGPALTERDKENLRSAGQYGVTAVMEPFVTKGSQLREVREYLNACGHENIRIFAKIENRIGLRNLKELLPFADMIVIARGDLGNDMPLWELPAAQKDIEDICLRANKPFLVVTQMLASMTENEVPTRAEVSDIFNAVIDGAEAVMVTNETAVGKYPDLVIKYLKNTADEAVRWLDKR